jgi:hypothetical protein
MFGLGGLVIIVIAMAVALGLFLLAAFGVFPGFLRIVTRSFWCPFRNRRVTAEFREDAWDGKRLEVTRCSAFDPPTAIDCERLCLGLKRLPGAPGVVGVAGRKRGA